MAQTASKILGEFMDLQEVTARKLFGTAQRFDQLAEDLEVRAEALREQASAARAQALEHGAVLDMVLNAR